MDADFDRLLEEIRAGAVEVLNLARRKISTDGIHSLSKVLMNENNKVTELNLSGNDIGDDGIQFLSLALMNEHNKLRTLNVSINKIGTR